MAATQAKAPPKPKEPKVYGPWVGSQHESYRGHSILHNGEDSFAVHAGDASKCRKETKDPVTETITVKWEFGEVLARRTSMERAKSFIDDQIEASKKADSNKTPK